MAEAETDWQKKYRDLTREVEKSERAGKDTEQQLRQLLGYMSVALEGESVQFDSELDALKPLLQESCIEHLGFLKKISRRIEKQIQKREKSRTDQGVKVASALLKWIRMLRTQVANAGAQNLLDNLEQRSNEVKEQLYLLPPLLDDLIQMQSNIEVNSSTGSTSGVAEGDYDLDTTASSDALGDEVRLLLNRIGSELLELISGLYVPKEEGANARELVKRIENGFELPHLPEIVHQVVQLVIKSTSNTSEDFENYLIELSTRLTEVQTFVVDSRQEQAEIGKNQRDLDMQVRTDVKKLHHTVKNADDLNNLKKAVSLQLSGLVKAMDEFKRKEEEREVRLQGRYEDLIDKVELMEQETRKVQAHMEEERLRARTDPLTGLPNRAAYDEQIAQEFERWQRYQTPFAVVVCDLDLFKQVNDSYGHLAGDKVLRLVAKVITKNIRVTDFAARYGGEEFIIVLPSTEAEDARQAMEKIRESLEKSPFNFHGKPVAITMSFGVTQVAAEDDIEKTFQRADTALYEAKEAGRNKVCVK